jgi:hypothetical protein
VHARDGHVHHVHDPAAVRLAEHQLPAGHIRYMPVDVVLRQPEAATQATVVPIRGYHVYIDRVWTEGLLYKLRFLPALLFLTLKSFLSKCTFAVEKI